MPSITLSSVALVVVLALLIALFWSLRNDPLEYRQFKADARTEGRQVYFRQWLVKSFVMYSVVPLIVLALFGRMDALIDLPVEFAALHEGEHALPQAGAIAVDAGISPVLAAGMVSALVLGAFIAFAAARLFGTKSTAVGDVEPMIPRNRAEYGWATALSLNAGIGEELFFRLLLPLLLTVGGVPVLLSFCVAALVFGSAHAYQGWAGAAVTTLMAAFLSFLYLRMGSLWLVVVLHVVMNLNGLIVRPWLARHGRKGKGVSVT